MTKKTRPRFLPPSESGRVTKLRPHLSQYRAQQDYQIMSRPFAQSVATTEYKVVPLSAPCGALGSRPGTTGCLYLLTRLAVTQGRRSVGEGASQYFRERDTHDVLDNDKVFPSRSR